MIDPTITTQAIQSQLPIWLICLLVFTPIVVAFLQWFLTNRKTIREGTSHGQRHQKIEDSLVEIENKLTNVSNITENVSNSLKEFKQYSDDQDQIIIEEQRQGLSNNRLLFETQIEQLTNAIKDVAKKSDDYFQLGIKMHENSKVNIEEARGFAQELRNQSKKGIEELYREVHGLQSLMFIIMTPVTSLTLLDVELIKREVMGYIDDNGNSVLKCRYNKWLIDVDNNMETIKKNTDVADIKPKKIKR